jgi:hypothetical protein
MNAMEVLEVLHNGLSASLVESRMYNGKIAWELWDLRLNDRHNHERTFVGRVHGKVAIALIGQGEIECIGTDERGHNVWIVPAVVSEEAEADMRNLANLSHSFAAYCESH